MGAFKQLAVQEEDRVSRALYNIQEVEFQESVEEQERVCRIVSVFFLSAFVIPTLGYVVYLLAL